ncbi:MAG TPA: hypothetical protein VH280_05770 [Verrucomicrobiae bacterium]|jgi:hypothetical protein|nr:hypothetical protein [Verrucomicrobiae bacterium]
MTPARTNEFVPLVAAAPSGDSREFQITVIPQNGHAQPFESLGTKPAGSSSNKNGEPQLTVQRDGNRITHIRIQCNCGQIHDIACAYEEPAKVEKAPGPGKAVEFELTPDAEKPPKSGKSPKPAKPAKPAKSKA